MRELLLWLSINNLPIRTYEKIENLCGSLEDFFSESMRKNLKKIIPKAMLSQFENSNIDSAREKIKRIEENFKIISIEDIDYPDNLRYIEDYPRVLYYEGDISLLKGHLLAMVGARKCTDYSKWVVSHIMKDLKKYDFTIVSGLALGVDSLSHRAAIENGLKTIGVLGTGIDKEYPAANRALYKEMKKNHLIITEFPPGTFGATQNFPQRNRIISGVSSATCVIEAKKRSGSLITARNAFEQGREVFAVPGNINSIYSEGTNSLIADGAIPLLDYRDILEAVGEFRDMERDSEETGIEVSLNTKEQEVLNIIKPYPISIDEISDILKEEVSEISAVLTSLEIKGIICETKGKFTLC